MRTDTLTPTPMQEQTSTRRQPRGVFQKIPGKNSPWWIRYVDAQGRFRREKAGTKGAAIDLYRKRKNEALEGKKLPEKLRRAAVSFKEIATDALAYSKTHKRSYRDDAYRMKQLLDWFGPRVADSTTPGNRTRTRRHCGIKEMVPCDRQPASLAAFHDLPPCYPKWKSAGESGKASAAQTGEQRPRPIPGRKRGGHVACQNPGALPGEGTGIRSGVAHRNAPQ
jgi:hypothetical protein